MHAVPDISRVSVCVRVVAGWLCRDPTLTTIVTLLSAYSSYYVADRLVGASGLLAVVCNGFTMSLIGKLAPSTRLSAGPVLKLFCLPACLPPPHTNVTVTCCIPLASLAASLRAGGCKTARSLIRDTRPHN
jgi:hypothetical protein